MRFETEKKKGATIFQAGKYAYFFHSFQAAYAYKPYAYKNNMYFFW